MAARKTQDSKSLLKNKAEGIKTDKTSWVEYHIDLEIRRKLGLSLIQFKAYMRPEDFKTIGTARQKILSLRRQGLFDRDKAPELVINR